MDDSHPVSWSEQDAAAVSRVDALLDGMAPLGVAFSGGVDSSVLIALAARHLGADRVIAILGVSPSLAADERAAAHHVADVVGVRVIEIQTREGERPEYRPNGPDRCFPADSPAGPGLKPSTRKQAHAPARSEDRHRATGSYPDRTSTGRRRQAYEHEEIPWHYVTVSSPALLAHESWRLQ
jgi:hypothetical protein